MCTHFLFTQILESGSYAEGVWLDAAKKKASEKRAWEENLKVLKAAAAWHLNHLGLVMGMGFIIGSSVFLCWVHLRVRPCARQMSHCGTQQRRVSSFVSLFSWQLCLSAAAVVCTDLFLHSLFPLPVRSYTMAGLLSIPHPQQRGSGFWLMLKLDKAGTCRVRRAGLTDLESFVIG